MANEKSGDIRVKMNFRQSVELLYPYAKKRIIEQIKSISLIVLYLIFFQIFVLGLPVVKMPSIIGGIILVVLGLAFFMEGLVLGLMPLGEICGLRLPQKSPLLPILIFAFILGLGATFAEPAIGVLKASGSYIKPWDAPLLFLFLNKYSIFLIFAIAIGVGCAVLFGILKFIYNWSLKPFIFIIIPILILVSIYANFDKNLVSIIGLAWDCGGITTGPVTVPLIISLGIGIAKVYASKNGGVASGFGAVTLASAFPILTVLILGIFLNANVIKPTTENDFYKIENRDKIISIFNDKEHFFYFTLNYASEKSVNSLFEDGKETKYDFTNNLITNINETKRYFKNEEVLLKFIDKNFNADEITVLKKNLQIEKKSNPVKEKPIFVNLLKSFLISSQAILPLCIFLLLVLFFIREKLRYFDEIILGIVFAVIGMTFFNIGIDLGLSNLGTQVGYKLPSSFKTIELEDQKKIINNFDKNLLFESINEAGTREKFFYVKEDNKYVSLPFDEKNYNDNTKQYTYIPKKGPRNDKFGYLSGILIVILFAFTMGYGASLAEPALNTLGATIEELSVGSFKKTLLIQSVAIGVGVGIAFGVSKIIWNIPIIYILALPYLILIFLTLISSEDFVNIAWDSAGVTTGPITVPLVVALGLGIGGNIGVVEGFGILAAASVFPILSVLLVGLYVSIKRKKYD